MSYDFSIINWQALELPRRNNNGEFVCDGLGPTKKVRSAIKKCFRKSNWNDQLYGTLEYRDHLIEFNLHESDNMNSFMVHTHDDSALKALKRLCEKHNWSAYDEQLDEISNLEVKPPDFDEYCKEIIQRMFGKKEPQCNFDGAEKTEYEQFFLNFIQLMYEQSIKVKHLYSDDAEITVLTNGVPRKSYGKDMKQQLDKLLELAQKNKTKVFNSSYIKPFYYIKDVDTVTVACIRHCHSLNQLSPYLVKLKKTSGEIQIIEEKAEASI